MSTPSHVLALIHDHVSAFAAATTSFGASAAYLAAGVPTGLPSWWVVFTSLVLTPL